MLDEDRGFYRRRIEQERSAADSAARPDVRRVHLRLLDLYVGLLRQLDEPSAWDLQAPPRFGRGSVIGGMASSSAPSSSLKQGA